MPDTNKEKYLGEGWSLDVTVKGKTKTHYYKAGASLCGKAKTKKHMKVFDKQRTGSRFFCDCGICIRKQIELMSDEPMSYKKYDY